MMQRAFEQRHGPTTLISRTWRCFRSLALVRSAWVAIVFIAFAGTDSVASTRSGSQPKAAAPTPARAAAPVAAAGQAEARLIEVYRLIGQGQMRLALERAGRLVADYPNFQLAQLVYGDLLSAQTRPVQALGDVPASLSAATNLGALREEAQLRLKALRERPPADSVPSQFVNLSARSRHAIAVDVSRARLYLFANTGSGLRLLGDYYISVGKDGIDKAAEGDLRTPLGVYYVTSNLSPRSLKDFYGVGALPINYPNPLDNLRGKTGSGIWLHGTPTTQFARAPKASDGCVVLANPDLQHLINTIEVRSTPVVITPKIDWVKPHSLQPQQRAFDATLQAWQQAKSNADVTRLLGFYAPNFSSYDKNLAQWVPELRSQVQRLRGRPVQLKDVSLLHWKDSAETMVVTFAELVAGQRNGVTRRQYWQRQGSNWRIFFEGVIG